MSEAMSADRLANIGSALQVTEGPTIAHELYAEVDRLRQENAQLHGHLTAEMGISKEAAARLEEAQARLAEIGETREEFGVRTYDEDIEVMSSREQARDLAEAWRREIPGSDPTIMARTRQNKPGKWREVPDA